MVRIHKTRYFSIPQLVSIGISKEHPLIRNLFDTRIQHAPLTRRLKFHLKIWEKLTQDGNTLPIFQGFKILFSRTLFQHTLPSRKETIDKFIDTENV